ncbi:hypothetical protein F53441_8466 [Fusarium austroafricanum]|uniref:Uncharacterized protein n=1 Tax=Fusarium austroafricanum TaxID=2364996 RepID=A0A8H4KFF9_9HYPO|nr:hypothetical protein F53441_8466 [Fusarium austroafricanum]
MSDVHNHDHEAAARSGLADDFEGLYLDYMLIGIIQKLLKRCSENLSANFPVLKLEREFQENASDIQNLYTDVRQMQELGLDAGVPLAQIADKGIRSRELQEEIKKEVRETNLSEAEGSFRAWMDDFMEEAQEPMENILVRFRRPWDGSREPDMRPLLLPVSQNVGEDGGPGGTLPAGDINGDYQSDDYQPYAPQSEASSKRPSPDVDEEVPAPKRRLTHRTLSISLETLEQNFSNQRVTEVPKGSGNWYVFRCEEHNMLFEGGARPAQAASRHAIAHGMHFTHASAVEAFGARVMGCDAKSAKEHNANIGEAIEQSRLESTLLHADLQPQEPQEPDCRPVRRAAQNRQRFFLSPSPSGFQKPPKIFPEEIYWVHWHEDDLYYPCLVLPWGPMPRLCSTKCAPVEMNLLHSEYELPRCYDRRRGFCGVWAKGYKDGQAKVSERQYPVVYFAAGKRFPRGCDVGFVKARDIYVYEEEKETPQQKAAVDSWLERRDGAVTPIRNLRGLDLVSPTRSSSTEHGSVNNSRAQGVSRESRSDDSDRESVSPEPCPQWASDSGSESEGDRNMVYHDRLSFEFDSPLPNARPGTHHHPLPVPKTT